MRRIITALTLVAFAAASAPLDWRLATAQEVSPETSQRLRDAVDRLRGGGNDATGDASAEELLDAAALEELVAPFALYPDALLAQVLVAATYPDQIARANDLIARTDGMSDAELASALEAEDWDPSVLVLLSGFPTVVTRMAGDPEATRRLGAAMIDQDQDVLAAAQRLRVKAEAAGNLSSNEAQTVTREDDEISIRPAKRDLVYVPSYDPDTVYVPSRSGQTYVPPPAPAVQSGSGAQTALIAGAVAFGGGLLVSQLFKDDDAPDSGWDDYWRRDRVIDWRDRQFYPRSAREVRGDAWGRERDRYWDRSDRRWSRDEAARRHYAEDRRSALRWTGFGDPGREHDREEVSSWRERAAREQAREERAAARKREERRERRKDAASDRRETAEQAAKARAAVERERDREAARAREDRARRAAAREDAARAKEKDRTSGKKDPRPAAQVEKKSEPERKPKAEKTSERPKPAADQKKPRLEKPRQERARQEKARQEKPRRDQGRPAESQARNKQEKKQEGGNRCREGDDRKACR